MSQPSARVIADSTYRDGVRLTTMEVSFHRFVLAEFNSHRVFSRNSSSSRAIPVARQLSRLAANPADPVAWPLQKSGMQGRDEMRDSSDVVRLWREQRQSAVRTAEALARAGLHKSVTSRILEPFMWHTCVVTSTAWKNFFEQRSSPLAQPEIRAVSEAMYAAYMASRPRELSTGEWHLPYVAEDEKLSDCGPSPRQTEYLTRISAARCARTSYLSQSGLRESSLDLALYDKLVGAEPPHWSPLEHVATPWRQNRDSGSVEFISLSGESLSVPTGHLPRVGNLLGWRSLRVEVEWTQQVHTYQ